MAEGLANALGSLQLELSEDIKHCFENLIVIDAGANLINKKYSRDLESVIQRAKDAGKDKNFHTIHHMYMILRVIYGRRLFHSYWRRRVSSSPHTFDDNDDLSLLLRYYFSYDKKKQTVCVVFFMPSICCVFCC